jgi:hypothetical protein
MWHRLTLLLLLSLPSLASAQNGSSSDVVAEELRDLMGARAYGMGGAWRALGLGAEAGTGNPAALALIRSYRVELTGGWDWENQDAFAMVAVADSSTGLLSAGVTYQYASFDRDNLRLTAHLNTLALALPLADSLLLGANVRYALLRGARRDNVVTTDVGLVLRPTETISLGASAHNLVDTGLPELTRYYSVHAGVLAGLLTLAADVRADFKTGGDTTLTYSGGLEYLMGQTFPVRAGYTYDGFTRSSQLGVGLGFLTQGGGVDLAYRHDFGGEGGRLLALTLRMQVH